MLLSKSCVYGLRAALYLASRKEGEYTAIKEMSRKLDISFHFLTKILQQLTAAHFMESYKGPNGGLRLSAKGRAATLFDLVVTIDGDDLFTQCALGLPGCGSEKPCPLHNTWQDTRADIKDMFQKTTLDNLGKQGKENKFRISATGEFSWS